MDKWWVAYKGIIVGIIISITGFLGTFIPLTIDIILKKYSYQTILRATIIVIIVLVGPLIFALKGHLTYSKQSIIIQTN